MSSSDAMTCPFPGSPPLSTDIAGIGVRISIYVQAFLTVIFLTVSPDISRVYDQCFPFVVMNISIMVAALVLGFSSNPQINLQDAIVAWFFTFIPIFVLMISGNKLKNRNKIHNALNSSDWDLIPNIVSFLVMWTLHAGFSLALFRHYKTFGSMQPCNGAARAFIFGTHNITNKWLIGLAVAYAIVLAVIYFSVTWRLVVLVFFLCSVREPRNEAERKEAARQRQHVQELIAAATAEANFKADYKWGFISFSLLSIWIAFTEVTVVKNNFAPATGPIWQFGQIFPMVLLAVPALTTIKGVSDFVQDTPERRAKMAQDPPPKERLELLATLDKIISEGPKTSTDPSDPAVNPDDAQAEPEPEAEAKSLNGFVRGFAFAVGYVIGLVNLLWFAIVLLVVSSLKLAFLLSITALTGTIMMLTGNAILRAHGDHYTNNKSAAAIGATGAIFSGLLIVLFTAPFARRQSLQLPWLLAAAMVIIYASLTGTIGSKILLDAHVDLGGIDCLHATRAGAVGGAIFALEAGYVLPPIISPLYTLIMGS